MKTDRINELENQLNLIQKELQEIKREGSSKYEKFQDGEWIYVKGKTLCTVLKFKSYRENVLKYSLSIQQQENGSYTFREDGVFSTVGSAYEIRFATIEEIIDALKRIAEWKGFVPGVTYRSVEIPNDVRHKSYLNTKPQTIGKKIDVTFLSGRETIHCWYQSGAIYVDGQWAEIVKDFEIVSGYKVQFIDSYVCEINGKRYVKPQIQELITLIKKINDESDAITPIITSINVGCNGQYKLTTADLQDLLTYWK